MSKSNDVPSSAVNLICDGTNIKGDVRASKDIRIDGFLNGTLNVNGKVVVGSTGVIEGRIESKTLDISGKVEGTIKASELVNLKSTAIVIGDIITDKISIEPGAKFTGSCKMGDTPAKKVHANGYNKNETRHEEKTKQGKN
ncbi:MAG: polymer-forming cytoskeletal protein [Marinifilaceae bacterium]|nr:polymer-forming cytoskeletal protein [Marinifilaceae bacterium]